MRSAVVINVDHIQMKKKLWLDTWIKFDWSNCYPTKSAPTKSTMVIMKTTPKNDFLGLYVRNSDNFNHIIELICPLSSRVFTWIYI